MNDSADVGRPWSPGTATGIGSLPGTDPVEAVKTVLGELPELPHLPELPARGPGADLIGRGASFLVDLPVEIQPSGWRLAAHPGRDVRRARDFVSWDLDALQGQAADYTGSVKVQLAGPWTLAAGIELPTGHRVVTDHGATRDLTESLAEGTRVLLADLAERLPQATIVVQFDEPSVPAVLSGMLPTASGYGTVRSVERSVVEQALADVLEAVPAGRRAIHCCARDAPIGLFASAGANAISLDLPTITTRDYDALGEASDAGVSLWLGVVPGVDAPISFAGGRDLLTGFWNRLGMPASSLAERTVPTPACGLAGASFDYARRAMAVVRDVGRAALDAT